MTSFRVLFGHGVLGAVPVCGHMASVSVSVSSECPVSVMVQSCLRVIVVALIMSLWKMFRFCDNSWLNHYYLKNKVIVPHASVRTLVNSTFCYCFWLNLFGVIKPSDMNLSTVSCHQGHYHHQHHSLSTLLLAASVTDFKLLIFLKK